MRRSGTTWRCIGLALALVAAPTARAAPAVAGRSAAEVLAGLERWLEGTRDLAGGFRQSLVSGAFGEGLEERGRLFVQRPGRMRWDYREPERKVALVDGERTWLYLEREHELTLGRLDASGRLLPALLAGSQPLSELFQADLVAGPGEGAEKTYRLELRPRSDAEVFERVVVVLSADDFAVEQAEVQDAAGNRMLYHFTDLRRNRGLPEALFRFDPPGGTVVVGQH